jgi:hypothetical protein
MLDAIKHAVEISQRCQRNWDVHRELPKEVISVLLDVVKKSPTKQNEDYYSVIFITDRNTIEEIYNHTTFSTAAGLSSDLSKNPQVLANLLVAFCSKEPTTFRNPIEEYNDVQLTETNRNQAIGIASGQLVMASALLGLKTGFCGCFNSEQVSNILTSSDVKLLIGIGYPDNTKDRRQHQNIDAMLGTFNKPIDITFISPEGRTVESIYEHSSASHSIFISYKPPAPKSNLLDLSWMLEYGLSAIDIETATLEIHKICYELNIISTSDIHIENDVLYSTWRGDSMDNLIAAKARILKIDVIHTLCNNLRSAGWVVE